ncbi:MAG: SUMF1/EgtB/PvdO family nonheme iron enzyme [Planctomycetes bacterium]|nr:SUMF1/EgtB/PvdO family nonheme iron enzyme [Planctomycetota bacterium]
MSAVVDAVGAPAGARVAIDGVSALRRGDQFTADVEVERDGVQELVAEVTGDGVAASSVRRRVVVDTTAPKLVVTEPSDLTAETESATFRVKGHVEDASSVTVLAAGHEVTRNGQDFEVELLLMAGESKQVVLQARDAAGHTSSAITVRVERKAAEPAWVGLRTKLLGVYATGDLRATSSALSSYEAAGGLLEGVPADLRTAVSGWRAKPALMIRAPASDSEVTDSQPELVIEWSVGRATDRLFVRGVETPLRAGRGVQRLSLPHALSEGMNEFELEVRDGREVRGTWRHRLRLARKARESEWIGPRARMLEEFARGDLGATSSALSSYEAAGGLLEGVPEGLLAAVSGWRAKPAVTVRTPASGSEVTEPQPELVIEWGAGRATDRLFVQAVETQLRAHRGVQRVRLQRPLSEGRNEIELEVRDGKEVRATWRHPLQYEPFRVPVPSWAHVSPAQIAEARRERIPVAFETQVSGLRSEEQLRFVLIPSGRFRMGSPAWEEGRDPDEREHEVELTRPYYLSIYEVTNGQYRAMVPGFPNNQFMRFEEWGNRRFATDAPRQPVRFVTHDEALRFASWLSSHGGGGHTYGLPTEAQWERAARGGVDGMAWPWQKAERQASAANAYDMATKLLFGIPTVGAPGDDGFRLSAPVGSFPPNGLGLYDMHGNVWEWCADWYAVDSYGAGVLRRDPVGPPTGSVHVQRGGGWLSSPSVLRSASRYKYNPAYGPDPFVGFRLLSPVPR